MSLNLNNSNDIICNSLHLIENGALVDINDKISASGGYTQSEADNLFYTKTYLNNALSNKVDTSALSNYYNKSQIDNTFTSYYLKTDIDNTFTNYYSSTYIDTNFYNKTYIDALNTSSSEYVKLNTTEYVVTVASKTSIHLYHGSGSSLAYFIDGDESPILLFKPGKNISLIYQTVVTMDTL